MNSEILQIMEPHAELVNCEENCEDLDEDTFIQDITLLLNHGVEMKDVEILKAAGINTIKGLQMLLKKKIMELTNFNEDKVNKIKEACSKIASGNCFMTALEAALQRKQVFQLTTGSNQLNKLLGGGIQSMSITEVFGEFGCGKTQLSHTLCVTAQMPRNDYQGGKVLFIDTENTFRPNRVREIAQRFQLNVEAVLSNILCARAFNSEHQFLLLNEAAKQFHSEAGVFKLLIVDSIMALFRVDFYGRGEMATRQHKLGQMLSRLQKISEEFNLAVFITNQISSDLSDKDKANGEVQRPIGGHVLAHAATTRIAFHKSGEKRIAKIFDSPELAEKEAEFCITEGGITDIN